MGAVREVSRDIWPATCPNCGSEDIAQLREADDRQSLVVTSDGQAIPDIRARRVVCRSCACLGVHILPEDRLHRFFSETYDLSDTVQDHPIVLNGRVVGKHFRVEEALWAAVEEGLPATGRMLEIACGRGDLIRGFQTRHPGWDCVAVDPSAESAQALAGQPLGIRHVREFFREALFPGLSFDLIVAHGLLNRTPVLPALRAMRAVSTPSAILSLDLLILEGSVCTPHVWDHSQMYTQPSFEQYVRHCGFDVCRATDCVTSVHFLCRRDHREAGTPLPGEEESRKAEGLFRAHERFWTDVAQRMDRVVEQVAGQPLALFGAGMYSAVLLSLRRPPGLSLVLDEYKAGSAFHGLPVVTPAQAAPDRPLVLVCARSAYAGVIQDKLAALGLDHVVLTPP
ncbi:MAG: methyltransferase domain-containing protein [Thermodesulfobacteriota bacterium]